MTRPCVSDWIGINCGNIVVLVGCPYGYEYRVEAVHSGGASVKCRALDYPDGITVFAYFHLTSGDRLTVVRKARDAHDVGRSAQQAPATVRKSAKRELQEYFASLKGSST